MGSTRALVPEIVRMVWTHPATHRQPVRALLRVAAWQFWKRVVRRPLRVPAFGSSFLRIFPDSDYALQAWYYGRPDYHGMHFIERYLRPGDGVLDVGANVGVFTVLAASLVGPHAAIDAVEAAPGTVARLRENLALNGLDQVRVHAVAAASEPGVLSFIVGDLDVLNRIPGEKDAGFETAEVPAARLDDLTAGRRYALGKMDIEGAEWSALHGATRMLAEASPPVWIVEMNGASHRYGISEQALADWLDEQGYDVGRYDADTHTLDCAPEAWARRGDHNDNVVLVARVAWDEVKNRLPGLRILHDRAAG